MIDMLQYIPWEMRKSEVLNKYFSLLNRIFSEYEKDIKEKSNFTIIDDLVGNRLNIYGERFTIKRKEGWNDETLRRIIKMRRHIYNRDFGIVGNLANLMETATGYEISLERNGTSGELDATVIINPDLSNDLMLEFDEYWVFGCKLNTEVKEIGFIVCESFGELEFCSNTGVRNFPLQFEAVTSGGKAGYGLYETFGKLTFCVNTGFDNFPIRTSFLEIV